MPAVAPDPPPEALYVGRSTVDLDVRFWCDARQLEMRRTLSGAIEAVKTAFDEQGIEMPSDVVALQATPSLAAALHRGDLPPGGGVTRTAGPNRVRGRDPDGASRPS